MTRIMHRAGIGVTHGAGVGVTHGAGDGLLEFPSDLADAGTAGSAAAFSVQTSDASALVTLASSIRGSDAPALCMRVLVAVSVTARGGVPRRRRAPLDLPMSDIPRVVFPDYKRKSPVAMTQKEKGHPPALAVFFGTHELPGADCPIQKAAPRRLSGYVTTIGTEPQVAPFRAAITRS